MTANGHAAADAAPPDEDTNKLASLFLAEWPQVDEDALRQTLRQAPLTLARGTAADADLLVALIATETDHTKALVTQQVDELLAVARSRGRDTPPTTNDDASPGRDAELQRLRRMVDRLTARSNEVSQYVRQQMIQDARGQVAKNPLVTLLMAVGLGFIFGFMLRGLGRGRGA